MTLSKTVQRNRVASYRSGIIENVHYVHGAVTDSQGTILFSIGDPSRVTLARSAAKPAQAIAIIETGGFHDAAFDQVDLALICASHNGEDRHVERARAMLAKVGAEESQFRCGGHPSISPAVNKIWAKRGLDYAGGIYNNCSGKHAGMMAGALALGADIKDYHLPNHPMQVCVKRVIEDLCPDPAQIRWGLDGCNLPAPAFPISNLAHIYANFAAAVDAPEQSSCGRTRNLAKVFHAMTQHPEFVAGSGRFCTDLMKTYKGQLMGKLGADGCYAIGIRESDDTRRLGVHGAMGISLKVDDGNYEVLYAVVMEVLDELGIGTLELRNALQEWHHPQRQNTAGVVVGSVQFDIDLRDERRDNH
ncbi:L-asparaginase II [Fusarium tricinctum]|uniref:L-asparaginase II n=1 Tax=Fusarium tricinctum TaxID=61284 RepID=A0A8K0RU68_9HYPO|nr:L-asparaginase II [Fusarium tricinctum]